MLVIGIGFAANTHIAAISMKVQLEEQNHHTLGKPSILNAVFATCSSSWGPFVPLDFVLRALQSLRPQDTRRNTVTAAARKNRVGKILKMVCCGHPDFFDGVEELPILVG